MAPRKRPAEAKGTGLGRSAQLLLLASLGLAGPAYAFLRVDDAKAQQLILASAIVAFLGFLGTRWLIPHAANKLQKRGICGKDLNKAGTAAGEVPIPEAAGLATGCCFLLCVIAFELIHAYDVGNVLRWAAGGFPPSARPLPEPIPESWIVDYNAALATIGFMLFLGFADDVLDVRWRVKLILPFFAALPLLTAYQGGTSVLVPKPLAALWPRGLLGFEALPHLLDVGLLYYGYMVALTIFCTNSINILAGVNGLEAGQTFVVACAILLHNLASIAGLWPFGAAGGAPAAGAVRDGHLFSAYLMLPLAGVTMGLLAHNWYPSRVFVGDTFTYFAGMAIAVAGILGHFSETLLLFLVPQIFNFVYSIPQLFKIVPCPRHRLPVFDPKTGLLRPKDKPDWNLVNLVLQLGGNTTELRLCVRLLATQAVCCLLGFAVRVAMEGRWKGA